MVELRPLMTVDDVAPLFRTTPDGVRRRIRDGSFPIEPVMYGRGGALLFAPGEVEKFLSGSIRAQLKPKRWGKATRAAKT